VTSGIPATISDTSAITTVPPAKQIAVPEVETAVASASEVALPSALSVR
jgi:hypothetical protein